MHLVLRQRLPLPDETRGRQGEEGRRARRDRGQVVELGARVVARRQARPLAQPTVGPARLEVVEVHVREPVLLVLEVVHPGEEARGHAAEVGLALVVPRLSLLELPEAAFDAATLLEEHVVEERRGAPTRAEELVRDGRHARRQVPVGNGGLEAAVGQDHVRAQREARVAAREQGHVRREDARPRRPGVGEDHALALEPLLQPRGRVAVVAPEVRVVVAQGVDRDHEHTAAGLPRGAVALTRAAGDDEEREGDQEAAQHAHNGSEPRGQRRQVTSPLQPDPARRPPTA